MEKCKDFFRRLLARIKQAVTTAASATVSFFKRAIPATRDFFVNAYRKTVDFIKNFEWPDKKGWAHIWDNVTTGLLIFLFASPLIILAYILIWFVVK